ncbi:MAG: carotenoid biosynthesis protein [Myxococcales bacterium]|nr:carotenoid biosynthesis protein [Myxococcales bacterium]
MPHWLFEALCVAVVLITLAAMARHRGWPALAREYLALALAGFVGEETCIVFYDFYRYAPIWHGRAHRVPLLVPLIWPLVVLSSRAVVRALWPDAGPRTALFSALAVTLDASLMEVIAVRAGLWSWAEPGHLGVPLVGIAGWGFFAYGAGLVLDRGARPGYLVAVASAVAHAGIFASWWALFRWVLRGPLEPLSWGLLAAASLGATVAAARARARGHTLGPEVAVPRVIAASVFFVLLAVTAPGEPRYWLHTGLVAVPYLVATRWARSAQEDVLGQTRA